MAHAISNGIREVSDVDVQIKRIDEVKASDLIYPNAILFGTPNYLEYMSGELKHLLDDAYYKFHFEEKVNKLKEKPAAAFVCGKSKGFYLQRLQFKSPILKELERIIFKKLEMRKIVDGIYCYHGITPGPNSSIPSLTPKQVLLCKNVGRKLALSIKKE